MSDIVKPRAISGFPEWTPAQKLVESRMLRVIQDTFERFGFTPIETPAVERKEVLTAKGVVEKEIYALSRLAAADGEDPSTDLALHFDLTVPLARYVAQHFAHLVFPFRRYQIQKVWRGERPQAGRFREFYQCDIDAVGNGSLGLLADAEMPCVIASIFERLAIGDFLIRINNRKVLQGLIEHAGVTPESVPAAMRAIDGLDKVGPDAVRAELVREAGVGDAAATRLLDTLSAGADLAALAALDLGDGFASGVAELREVTAALEAYGLDPQRWCVDLGIARGLDYYTGTVYETRLVDAPELGSICSGGRYDDLASNYTKHHLPGVGISIGLTRLLYKLFEAGLVDATAQSPARVLVTVMEPDRLSDYLEMARDLRNAGVATEVYSEPKKLPKQLKYASQKGFSIALLAGSEELAAGSVQLKDLALGEQSAHPRAELVHAVRAVLDRA